MADPRKLKEKASEAFAAKKFAKAADYYADYCEADPKDLQARLRMGDALAKSGKKEKAIEAYTLAAEGFAKDGFLPRAIAASKLILELDPSHTGVQKMLAGLYARKSGPGPAPAAPARPQPLRVETKLEVPQSPAAFSQRKDAIELGVGPSLPARKPGGSKPAEVPSPMNRSDAIELPAYEVPSSEVVPSGTSFVPIATRGPSPTRNQDAIELAPEEARREGPAALFDRAIDFSSDPIPAPRPSSGIRLEVEPATVMGTEEEIPIAGEEIPIAAGVAVELPPTEFELQVDEPPPSPLGKVGLIQVAPPADPNRPVAAIETSHPVAEPPRSEPQRQKVWDLDAEVTESAGPIEELDLSDVAVGSELPGDGTPPPPPAPSLPPLPVSSGAPPSVLPPRVTDAPPPVKAPLPPAITDGAPPAVKAPLAPPSVPPAMPPEVLEAPAGLGLEASPGGRSAATAGPPGMKPRKVVEVTASSPSSPPPPPPAIQPAAAPPPSAPRIWLPGNFAAPVAPEVPLLPPEPAPAPVASGPVVSEALTDLERGMEIFSRFDVEDFAPEVVAPPAAAPPAELPPPEVEELVAAPPRRSFTELDLEGSSLLHSVETAAEIGLEQRGQDLALAITEEPMEIPDDAKLAPGELPKIPLFSDLPPDAFIALFERCPLKRLEPGELVIQQGSLGDAFYVICSGSVRVFRIEGERRRDVATLEEGAFFGEMALLSEAPRTASVEAASEDTQLLEISAPILTELSHHHPQVATALKKFCRQRLLSNMMNTAPLFEPFSRNDRRELVQRFKARDVPKGEVLIKEGQTSDGMYLILSGEVEVRVGAVPVATLKEGEVFGEMSLLTKAAATATVAATKRTSLLRLPRQDFDTLIMSHPQVLVLVAELTDARTRQNAALNTRTPSGATSMV